MKLFKKAGKLFFALVLSSLLVFPAACDSTNSTSSSSSPVQSSSSTPEEGQENSGNGILSAEGYNFGDPASWAGDSLVTEDLGDCLIEEYPYDERYDWGQSVMYDEDEGVYKMWWCRHSGMDSIWYAESTDLKHWTNAQKIMTVVEDTTWIKLHVGKPSVLKIDGDYIMYFEAPATLANGLKEFNNNIFRATSKDGINWSVYTGTTDEPYPVLRMTDEEMAESLAIAEASGGYGWYGIGQPSVLYKDGVYYMYHTYSLQDGDRFYVSTSTDGIHFERGQEVFRRAGSGVKYNALTQKFMMAYEYTQGRVSRVYYMESDDGVNFTYKDYTTAASNQNILSKGGGFVRGYPDFVGNGHGIVDTETAYVAYMEGRMADSGNDWRQYAYTWDIHIAAFNLPQYANRAMVLPNQTIIGDKALEPYRGAHVEYDHRLVGISKGAKNPVLDGLKDDLYDGATKLEIDRWVSERAAIPGSTTATAYVGYSSDYFYAFVEVNDSVVHEEGGDHVIIGFNETMGVDNASELVYIKACREGVITVYDGDGNPVEGVIVGVERMNGKYTVEALIPWRYKTSFEAYDAVGFDVYVFDNANTPHYLSILAWNDFRLSGPEAMGELYFKA